MRSPRSWGSGARWSRNGVPGSWPTGSTGCSNAAIAARLHFSEGAVGKHTANIFAKLDITASDDTNRRVLAVLTYLGAGT